MTPTSVVIKFLPSNITPISTATINMPVQHLYMQSADISLLSEI